MNLSVFSLVMCSTANFLISVLFNKFKVLEVLACCPVTSPFKSSLSEDIKAADEITRELGHGFIETIPGVGGGIRMRPGISSEEASFISRRTLLASAISKGVSMKIAQSR